MVIAAAAALAVAACGSTSKSRTSSSTAVTVGRLGPPVSLDPAKNDPGTIVYTQLAYDTLIYKRPDGKLVPDLAESWRYVGSSNRVFEITLRKGVRFSDGSALTARVARDSLLRFRAAGGPAAGFATYKSVDIVGPRTIRLQLSESNPVIEDFLTSALGEAMVCPKALKDAKLLTTKTCGAGPYVLDPAQTTADDHYTYVPNRYYWNKKAIHYHKIVIKVVANPDAMLAAMKTGQVDFAEGDASTLPAAKGADLKVSGTTILWVGAVLADRGGKKAAPLADQRVRQALNYAIDRKAITKAIWGEMGEPTDQLTREGVAGYRSLAARYPYDPAKAKQLLAQAGYAKGFTLKILSTPAANLDRMAQAMGSYLSKVGVKLEIQSEANNNQYSQDLFSTKYPAQMVVVAANNMYMDGKDLFTPDAPRNPFHTTDPDVSSLYAKGAAAPPDAAAGTYAALERRIVDLAWFAPVSLVKLFYYARPGVGGVDPTPTTPAVDLRELRPAGS